MNLALLVNALSFALLVAVCLVVEGLACVALTATSIASPTLDSTGAVAATSVAVVLATWWRWHRADAQEQREHVRRLAGSNVITFPHRDQLRLPRERRGQR